MSEKEEMVIPKSWNYVHRTADPFLNHFDDGKASKKVVTQILKDQIYAKRICYLIHNEKVIERCEYRVNAAICYNGKSITKIRAMKVDFSIREALYATMEDDKKMADYLILVGDDQLMFFHLGTSDHTVITVPFRVHKIFSTNFGILIERARVRGEQKSGEPMCHLYSLTHPFSEIYPVMYKSFHKDVPEYAFSKKRIAMLPSSVEKCENLYFAYDLETDKHMVFTLRRITQEEKTDALQNIDVLVTSFNSPCSSIASSIRAGSLRRLRGLNDELTPANSLRGSITGSNSTPLRRSIRNRVKQSKDQTLPLDEANLSFDSSCFSYYAPSDRRSVRNTFRVFNIDGNETDELEVEFMLVCVWIENLDFGRGATPQPFGTPLNTTPKSILSRRVDGTPGSVSGKELTPNRSVKFAQNDVDENEGQEQLVHKKPIYHTPVKQVSFHDVHGSGKTNSGISEADLDPTAFDNYPKMRQLAVVDELIARHRNQILQNVLPKDEKKPRKNMPISRHDYISARTKIMKHYARMMQGKLNKKDKAVRTYYAMLIYRRELYHILQNELRSKVCSHRRLRVASRFFVTSDFKGQKYLCFLIQSEEQLKLLKWDFDQDMAVGLPFSVEATDAIHVMGHNMIAVMRAEKSSVSLYTGTYEVGNMLMKPYRQSTHELLQFCDGYEKTVVVKMQHKKRLIVQNVMFDLDLISSEHVTKLFEAAFAVLPMSRAIRFFSTWCSANRWSTVDSDNSNNKPLFVEIPLLVEHFFISLGLDVRNLTCIEMVRKFRCSVDYPETKRDRISSQDSSDYEGSDEDELMEPPADGEMPIILNTTEYLLKAISGKRKISIFKAEGKEDFIQKYAFALFQVYHLLFESYNIFLTARKYKPLLLEPLYVFAKITGLENYAKHYQTYLKELEHIEIEVDSSVSLPNLREASGFNPENMVTFNMYLSLLKSHRSLSPPSIPESPHWPTTTLFSAAVALGKINSLDDIVTCLGSNWKKRLDLAPASEEALITAVSSKKSDKQIKCSRCVKLFCLSVGDIHVLHPALVKILSLALIDVSKKMEKEVARRLLKVFPSEQEENRWLRLRWPTDIRITNVYQMLDSRRQILIPVRRSGLPDDDTVNREQYNLFLINTYPKQVSKAFGHAAIGFRTTRASKVSSSHIPKIELSGRVPPNHVFHEFPANEISKAMTDWADFMTGTGHTLTLTDYDEEQISFNWLRQWQSTHRSGAVASGALFAYGLAGHFKNVNVHEIHKMIVKSKRAYEIISILLGAAITHRGTSHLVFYRAISTHIPSFIEPTLVELKFDAIVQTASILGIGLLFQGTANMSISNKITNEMAKETFFEGENESHRYSYVLSCGIAVGLINLARGVDIRNSEVPADDASYEIEDRLITLLEGGKRALCTDFGRRNEKLCRVQRIGAAALGSVALPPSANACTTIDFAALHGIGVNPEPNGMATAHNEVNRHTANSHTGVLTKEASTTRELSTVNIHLTPPGACIALALMYLKTGDRYILEKLRVPGNIPDIEGIRPDVLMLRTLCALMVDYHNVLPTEEYAEEQIPTTILDYVRDINVSNRCERWWSHSIDLCSVTEAYFYIKCGVCLALGIRYASTSNQEAYLTVRKFFAEVKPGSKRLETAKSRHYVKPALTNVCAAIAAYSLALIMAGSGDLTTLRAVRHIRNYLPEEIVIEGDPYTYPIQTYCNTALGFLFLGNAQYGFSTSNDATAMLLISSYPILPHSICDQKHYFQPMRFFWSIATEFRHLAPVDDDTQQPVRMRAYLNVKGTPSKMAFELPAVLPPLEIIETITLEARDYKSIEIDMRIKEDKEKFIRVLKEYYGRIPVKKIIKCYAKVFESIPSFKVSDALDADANVDLSRLVMLPMDTSDVDQIYGLGIKRNGILIQHRD